MNKFFKRTTIPLMVAFGMFATLCRADELDELLKQLEQAELKPAAKKPPAPPKVEAKKTAKEPIAKPSSKPAKSEKVTRPKSEAKQPTPARKAPGVGKREQRIMSFFKTKISPIAQGMYKLVESKDTQQLVETAKKRRLEIEKTAAARVGKAPVAKPRYSTVGGGGGRDGGYAGKGGAGWDGGGWGKGPGGWTSPTSSAWDKAGAGKPFEAPKGAVETKPTSTTTTDKKDEGTHFYGAQQEKPERTTSDFATEKQHILNLSKTIQGTLNGWLEKLDKPATRGSVIAEIQNGIDKLKDRILARTEALSEAGKLPEAEWKSLREELIKQEKDLWARLFQHDKNYDYYLKAQEVKKQIGAADTLLVQEEVLGGAGAQQNLTDPQEAQLQKLQQALTAIAPKITDPTLQALQNRLQQRLAQRAAVVYAAAPAAQQKAPTDIALENIKPDFLTQELKAAVDTFLAPAQAPAAP